MGVEIENKNGVRQKFVIEACADYLGQERLEKGLAPYGLTLVFGAGFAQAGQ